MDIYDAVIIGSGVAGLSTAVAAAEEGLRVCVLTKEEDTSECNTYYAQGGIVGEGINDTPELLAEDIMNAGDYLNFREAVNLLAAEGPKCVREYLIEKAKVPFYRDKKGELDRTREGAHSTRRILHVRDESGKAVETGLLRYAETFSNINFFRNHISIDLITNSHHARHTDERYKRARVIGVYALNEDSGEVVSIFGSAVDRKSTRLNSSHYS